MKSIFEKIEQLKYSYLKKLFKKNLSKRPDNCKYNKEIILPNKKKINVCTFNMKDNNLLDLCFKLEHSKNCNAFCALRSKEELREEFLSELKDEQKRAEKYKDLNILFWLYPEYMEEYSIKKNIFIRIKRWLLFWYQNLKT